MMRSRPVVAIDGPAASGKSTTARAVAQALGFTHLDSGALYRAVTFAALARLGPSETWTDDAVVAAAAAGGLAVSADGGTMRLTLDGTDPADALRSEAVTREVSRVAALPAVREFVNHLLRAAASEGGVVMDGRDIGTVVFPDADVKVFMVADAQERARRRLREKGRAEDPGTVRMEAGALQARDARDSTRVVAPLLPAPDAVFIDTTTLAFDDQVGQVVDLARRALRG